MTVVLSVISERLGSAGMSSRILAALFLCVALNGSVHAGDANLPAPVDLQKDGAQGRREGKPVVILFSLPGCAFCHVVRQNYLMPMLRNVPAKDRPIIREVEITSTQTFVGFKGEPTSHQHFAKNFHIRFAPTVVFLDPSGQFLTDPIIGGDTAGLYGGYLDRAFAEAAKMLSSRHKE